jgi:hypothetical protein
VKKILQSKNIELVCGSSENAHISKEVKKVSILMESRIPFSAKDLKK